jgi:hypothetical protein
MGLILCLDSQVRLSLRSIIALLNTECAKMLEENPHLRVRVRSFFRRGVDDAQEAQEENLFGSDSCARDGSRAGWFAEAFATCARQDNEGGQTQADA